MSELKVNSIKGVNANTAAISIDNSSGTCTANLTNRTNKNLILNGAFLINQRGTSSTSSGYYTVDRFKVIYADTDEAPTQAQVDVASGTTPYTLGFRKAYKITNGNQTGGAGAGDYIRYSTVLEGQDINGSGWNFKSSSSFITLSFWIKSSVAQAFSGSIRALDGTPYFYKYDTPTLSADTWTKVTKTISGNSNLTFDNDNGAGFMFSLYGFIGTTFTSANSDTETWVANTGNDKFANDMTSTWYTTNDATLEITGIQLEVGDHATDFEHRSFAQELFLCERYYQRLNHISGQTAFAGGLAGLYNGATDIVIIHHYRVAKRAAPTFEYSALSDLDFEPHDNSVSGLALEMADTDVIVLRTTSTTSETKGHVCYLCIDQANGFMAFNAEL